MKRTKSNEFENFDKVMDGLLAVPYSELQKELAKEERAKAKKKRPISTASPASASRKKRGA